jgi:pilus assembly protein CpaE
MTRLGDDLFCLPAPASIQEAEDVRPRHIQRLFPILQNQFSHIIVDCQRQLDPTTLAVLDLADTILVVSTADPLSVYNAKRALSFLGDLGYAEGKIKLVVNGYDRNGGLKSEKLEHLFGAPIDAILSNDATAASYAMNLGQPLIYSQPKSLLVSQYANLARIVTGQSKRRDQVSKAGGVGLLVSPLKALFGSNQKAVAYAVGRI